MLPLHKTCSLILILMAPMTYSQTDKQLNLKNEVSVSDEIFLEDSLFDNVFDEQLSNSTDSWLDDFTLSVS